MAPTTPTPPSPPPVADAPADDLARLPVVELPGARLHAITERQCIAVILDQLARRRGGWVVTHNLDHLHRLGADPAFDALCRTASLRVADGMPLIWASRLAGRPLPERVAGSNLISSLSAAAADHGRSIFLLGGSPGAADQAADVLRRRHPSLRIAGCLCPPMGFERDPAQIDHIRQTIASCSPDIIFVALGAPKQEQLIAQLAPHLPHAWWLGVGISFSFLAGHVRRAPLWMQKLGLEWLHRLAQEPGRLARRYLVDGLPLALALFVKALGMRWARKKT
ncbi:MAG: WecB/TagA/CpsF family glycosyltransferase [Phycisphaeraceae bacterium]|nr:WecB/TagA/CpsF family glycosyltransferase [Phycisphaeraceae bacterium]